MDFGGFGGGKPFKASKKKSAANNLFFGGNNTLRSAPAVNPDHENNFDTLADDIINGDHEKVLEDGSGDSDSDNEMGKKRKGQKHRDREGEEEQGDQVPPYMLFDFRKGPEHWPKNSELIDPKRYDELLEKATAAAEAAAKSKKKDGEEGEDGKKGDKEKDKDNDAWGEEEKEEKRDFLHPDAVFETLRDGSTALVIQAGYRLKLSLGDIFDGGDATREARLKKEAKEKKRMAKYASEWGGWGGGGGWGGSGGYGPDPWGKDYGSGGKYSTKRYLNEYTITMDIKLLEEPPREGISLYQTALLHVKENKRSGKTDISRSDGECMLNQAGGVGIFGTFGDTTKVGSVLNCCKV